MVASNGVDFVGSDNGRLYALNGLDGSVLWQYDAGQPVTIAAVANGAVYAYANNSNSAVAYALNASSGQVIWQYRASDYISQAIVESGIIYISTAATANRPALYALQAANGALLWRYNAHSVTPGLLDVSGSIVFNAEVSGLDSNFTEYITALRGSDGHVLWRLRTAASDGPAFGISAPADGVVYISANSGATYAVRVSDGALLWHVARAPAPGSPPVSAFVSPLVSNGVVYVTGKQEGGAGTQALYALRASDGTQLWTKVISSNPGPIADQPLLVSGILYVSSIGKISALRAADGSTLWQDQGNDAFGPLIPLDGRLYANSSDGVFVLRASDGTLLWKDSIPSHSSLMTGLTPEVVAGDIVYAASGDGVVESLNAANGRLLWRYAIQEKGMPTGVVDGAFITFTSSTSYQQALKMITDLGLQTSLPCAFSWKPQDAGNSFSTSHNLFVSSTVGAAPLWLYRLQASPNVASADVQTAFSCPNEPVDQKPSYLPPGQVGTYVRVTFSGANYDAALNAINNLGFRLTNPCYEQARARGKKPAWSSMGQEAAFAQTSSLLLATTRANAATWHSQLQALSGVTKIETPFQASC